MIGTMSCYTKLAIVGGLVLTAASLFWPSVLTTLMYKELKLSPGSKSFQHWKETPVPMYIDIYFHNWTNAHKVYTEKPHFKEMGPYRFFEKRTKVDLVWNDNGTVSYRQTRQWHFDEQASVGTLEDNVTTLNMIAATIAHRLRFNAKTDQVVMSWGFTTTFKYEVYVVKSVRELLFEGYADDFLTLLKLHPEYSRQVSDRFGWFYKRNGSEEVDGLFNMDTGAKDLTQVGKIRSWNGQTRHEFFPGACGEVAGTSGEVFPPWLTPKDRLGLFSGDLCRTIYLGYEKENAVQGIKGLKFTGGTDFVDSGIVDPATACYKTGEATPLGLLNITGCRQGSPIFVSYPHFYLGDASLLEQVSGLNPDQEKHGFEITVEPTFGVPLDIKGRFQVNMMLEPNRNYLLYRELPRRMYIPLLWFDQRANLTEPIAEEVRLMVTMHNISTNAATALLVVGLVLAATGITAACRAINQAPPNKLIHYTVHTLAEAASRVATPRATPKPSPRPSPASSLYLRPSPRASPRASPSPSPCPSPQPRPMNLTVDWGS